MKHFTKFMSVCALVALCAMTSCREDEPEPLQPLALTFEQTTFAIEQGEEIEIPFEIENVSGAIIEVTLTNSHETEYPAVLTMDEEALPGEENGVIKVTAPEYIFESATVTLTVSVEDELNLRNAEQVLTLTSAIAENYVVVAEPANCYVVVPGSIVRFPAHIGNSSEKTAFESVALVWQDVQGLVTELRPMEGDVLAFLAPELQGNALVAVKDAEGTIVWSYHLWVTNSDPCTAAAMTYTYTIAATETTPEETGTYTMMDRYVGAITNEPGSDLSNGLFYQWGRKDPFTTSTYTNELKPVYDMEGNVVEKVIEPVAEENNVATGIKNPTTHYSGVSGGNWGWLSTNKGAFPAEEVAKLWSSTEKTIYDPCPAGWRVAPNNAWRFIGDESVTVEKVFTDGVEENKSLQGRKFNGFWFPSQGEVAHGGNLANGIGSNWPNGKAWSADIDAANYRAWATTSSPTSASFRGGIGFGYELPVRCVKAE